MTIQRGKKESDLHFKLKDLLFSYLQGKGEFKDTICLCEKPVRKYKESKEEIWDCYKPDIQIVPYIEPKGGKAGGAIFDPEQSAWIEIETDPLKVLHKLSSLCFLSRIEGFPKPRTLIFGIPQFDETKRFHPIKYVKRLGESITLKDVLNEFILTIKELNQILKIKDLRIYAISQKKEEINRIC